MGQETLFGRAQATAVCVRCRTTYNLLPFSVSVHACVGKTPLRNTPPPAERHTAQEDTGHERRTHRLHNSSTGSEKGKRAEQAVADCHPQIVRYCANYPLILQVFGGAWRTAKKLGVFSVTLFRDWLEDDREPIRVPRHEIPEGRTIWQTTTARRHPLSESSGAMNGALG